MYRVIGGRGRESLRPTKNKGVALRMTILIGWSIECADFFGGDQGEGAVAGLGGTCERAAANNF